MAAYYNEIDPKAAAWLRELIRRNLIAPGDVDERSIVDVRADDLRGYRQCHFFAGIGVWSYALRLAGWSDDRPVWTGSCPCQPFSAAGKGDEFADERHLWPAWFRLIRELGPDAIFGEQVSSKDALTWFDHVRVDLEGEGYAIGVLDTCAAGVGAPHIRQRLYFVGVGHEGRFSECGELDGDPAQPGVGASRRNDVSRCGIMVDAERAGSQGRERSGDVELPRGAGAVRPTAEAGALNGFWSDADGRGESGDMGDAASAGLQTEWRATEQCGSDADSAGATNGFWRDAEWLPCRDGKARPVKPGTFPLAHGVANRVVKLRGLGNAIVAEQAATFIESYLEVIS